MLCCACEVSDAGVGLLDYISVELGMILRDNTMRNGFVWFSSLSFLLLCPNPRTYGEFRSGRIRIMLGCIGAYSEYIHVFRLQDKQYTDDLCSECYVFRS